MMRLKRPSWRVTATPFAHWKILRGDRVEVMSGRSKGQRGQVKQVLRARNAVVVEGVNLIKKHQAGSGSMKGGVYTREAPLPVSTVALVDPSDDRPCKVRWVFVAGGAKERQSRRSGVVVPRNDLVLKSRTRQVSEGPLDTAPEEVTRGSFSPLELVPQLNWNRPRGSKA